MKRRVAVMMSVAQPPDDLETLPERFAFRRLRTKEARKDLEYILDKFKDQVKILPEDSEHQISPIFVVEGEDAAIEYLKGIASERNIVVEEE